jgi:CRP/FNR family transcriptional regulator
MTTDPFATPTLEAPSKGNVRCTASDVLRWAGMATLANSDTDAIWFPLRRVRAERPLIHEGQPFESLHVVSGGSFKYIQTDIEGYEQVLGFAIHGDMVGLDGLGHTTHTTGAVALEDSTVVAIPFRELLALGRDVPALEALLHHAAGDEVVRRGDTQYLMAAPSSEVRVARFLLQLAERQAALGHSASRLRLCMTRRDIASYLGVAHETVSRAFTRLATDGLITVSQRDIELIDLPALRELQRMTRGRLSYEEHASHRGLGAHEPAAHAAPGQPALH